MSIIQLRRDTTANWLSVNPVLAQGELGIAYNGDVVATIRIGNGAATWTQLPDFGGNGDLTQAAADLLYATLAQGELADTAVQPGDLPTFGDVVTHNASEFATAAQGTDARTPTAHAASHATAGTDPLTLAQSQVTGLTSDLAAKVGTSDPRLTDPRTPTSHAASHAAAGADPLTVAQSQVTNLGTDLAAKVPTSRTIAGLGLDADRSSADLKTALTLVKGDVGLGNVDNTADADKPVSTPQAAAIGNAVSTASLDATSKANTAQANAISAAAADATSKADAKVADAINDGTTTVAPSQNAVFDALAMKADLASPALTGNPTAPTQAQGNNSTRLATTAYVQTEAGLSVPKSTVTTKGDLIVGTGSGAVTRRGVGSNGQVLTADSTQTDGVKWADAEVAGVVSPVHSQEAKYGSSDTWAVPGDGYASFGSFSPSANTFYPVPFVVSSQITVTAIAAAQIAGGTAGNMRLLIYAADVDWQASGAALLDTGSISTATNAVKSATGLSAVLTPGRYLRCFICDVGGLSYRVGGVSRTFLGPGIDCLATRWTGSVTYGAPSSPVWNGHLVNASTSEVMIGMRWTV